jgi:hypothetical protein
VIPIFVGHDVRESAVFHVLQESLMDTCSEPFTICPLDLRQSIFGPRTDELRGLGHLHGLRHDVP